MSAEHQPKLDPDLVSEPQSPPPEIPDNNTEAEASTADKLASLTPAKQVVHITRDHVERLRRQSDDMADEIKRLHKVEVRLAQSEQSLKMLQGLAAAFTVAMVVGTGLTSTCEKGGAGFGAGWGLIGVGAISQVITVITSRGKRD